MGACRNSTETQQSCHAPRSRPEVKSGKEVVPTMACWRGSDAGQSRRRRVRSYRGCPVFTGAARKILFYLAYVRGQEKAVTVAAKSEQFTVDEMGKGQFL